MSISVLLFFIFVFLTIYVFNPDQPLGSSYSSTSFVRKITFIGAKLKKIVGESTKILNLPLCLTKKTFVVKFRGKTEAKTMQKTI